MAALQNGGIVNPDSKGDSELSCRLPASCLFTIPYTRKVIEDFAAPNLKFATKVEEQEWRSAFHVRLLAATRAREASRAAMHAARRAEAMHKAYVDAHVQYIRLSRNALDA